jgi:hypothetical protein
MDSLNWMVYSWSEDRNIILADEMGLGKTVQASGGQRVTCQAHAYTHTHIHTHIHAAHTHTHTQHAYTASRAGVTRDGCEREPNAPTLE